MEVSYQEPKPRTMKLFRSLDEAKVSDIVRAYSRSLETKNLPFAHVGNVQMGIQRNGDFIEIEPGDLTLVEGVVTTVGEDEINKDSLQDLGEFLITLTNNSLPVGHSMECHLEIDGINQPLTAEFKKDSDPLDPDRIHFVFCDWSYGDNPPRPLYVPFDPNLFPKVNIALSTFETRGGEVN
jgi:hypothetical protein